MKIVISVIKVNFFFVLFISSSGIASEELPSNIMNNLRYHASSLTKDNVNPIEETLKKISQIDLGKKLIQILDHKLKEKNFTILALAGSSLSLNYINSEEKSKLTLEINPEK